MSVQAFRITGSLAILSLAVPSFAQSTLSFSVGGGPTVPAKHSSNRFNTGFNLSAGVGYHPVHNFGVMAEFGFNNLNISRTALDKSAFQADREGSIRLP